VKSPPKSGPIWFLSSSPPGIGLVPSHPVIDTQNIIKARVMPRVIIEIILLNQYVIFCEERNGLQNAKLTQGVDCKMQDWQK
jgi:hypothetical protein